MNENISSSHSPRRRNFTTAVVALTFALLLALVFRLLLQPDPQGLLLWARAQRLESSNLIRPALRQYALLARKYPTSPYAPLAHEREADILVDLARAGDVARFAEALSAYDEIVAKHPQTPSAPRALAAIGEISLNDLKDLKRAQAAYSALLENPDIEYSMFKALAMIGLGRVAKEKRDGKEAQKWFQRVLKEFPNDAARAGEAQFRLGETYEIVWRNKEFALNAYGATVANYAGTIWAARARENLGLLSYNERVPRARRVLVQTATLTGENEAAESADSATSLLSGLRMVLNARGLDVNDDIVRGWSLSPFVAAFDAQNPGRVVPLALDGFEKAVEVAGLTYAIDDGGDSKSARQNLQNEIDTGRLVLVYTGQWQLVIGYDSSKDVVFLANGTRAQTVKINDFIKSWNRRSPLGDNYTMLSFSTPGDDVREERLRAPQVVTRLLAPLKTDANPKTINLPNPELAKRKPLIKGTGVAFSPAGLSAPTWVLTPPKMAEIDIHRRALRRASELMRRERSNNALLNLGALRSIGGELRRLANAPDEVETSGETVSTPTPQLQDGEEPARQSSPAPFENATPESSPDASSPDASPSPDQSLDVSPDSTNADDNMGLTLPDNTPTPKNANALGATSSTRSNASVMPRPTPSVRVRPIARVSNNDTRLRAVLSWRNAPLENWIRARRDAATYLNVAAQRLKNPQLREAATAFQNAIAALEDARDAMNAAATGNNQNRVSLLTRAADAIERARQNETRATEIIAMQE